MFSVFSFYIIFCFLFSISHLKSLPFDVFMVLGCRCHCFAIFLLVFHNKFCVFLFLLVLFRLFNYSFNFHAKNKNNNILVFEFFSSFLWSFPIGVCVWIRARKIQKEKRNVCKWFKFIKIYIRMWSVVSVFRASNVEHKPNHLNHLKPNHLNSRHYRVERFFPVPKLMIRH